LSIPEVLGLTLTERSGTIVPFAEIVIGRFSLWTATVFSLRLVSRFDLTVGWL